MSDQRFNSHYALGVGLRPGCAPAELQYLVDTLLADSTIRAAQLIGVATWAKRGSAPALQALAGDLALPVITLDISALAAVDARVLTRSPRVRQRLGVDSVAEAAALALMDCAPDSVGVLLGPRRASLAATAALAGHAPTVGATVSPGLA